MTLMKTKQNKMWFETRAGRFSKSATRCLYSTSYWSPLPVFPCFHQVSIIFTFSTLFAVFNNRVDAGVLPVTVVKLPFTYINPSSNIKKRDTYFCEWDRDTNYFDLCRRQCLQCQEFTLNRVFFVNLMSPPCLLWAGGVILPPLHSITPRPIHFFASLLHTHIRHCQGTYLLLR